VTLMCVNPGALNTDTGVSPGASGCASGYTHVEVTVANAAIGSVSIEGLVANY